MTISRRRFTIAAAAMAILAGAALGGAAEAGQPKTIRLDWAYYNPVSLLLKDKGWLEQEFAGDGIAIQWTQSLGSNKALELLNSSSVDFGSTAGAAALLAMANGSEIQTVYVFSKPEWTALVVRADSPIQSVADLKGKRVAVTKAAGAHYLLIALLEGAGLKFKDIEPAYLSPADGRAAFEKGAVDAWVTWDPFLAGVQRQSKVRIIADGRPNVASYQRYYLASTPFAQARPEVLSAVFEELQSAGQWVKKNPGEAARLLAPVWGLDTATVELANSRRSYEVRVVNSASLDEQQKIADAFQSEGLLPRKVSTADVGLWKHH